MKIVVLDGYTLNPGDNPWAEVERLGELLVYDRTPLEQTLERAAGADIVLTNKAPLTADLIAGLPDLKFVSVLATGFNIVDVDAARRRGIPVSNVPEYGTSSVAQSVFALLLSHLHRIESHDQAIRGGQWSASGDFSFSLLPLTELAGKTMGIVGYGRIGREVARIATAFGMDVLAYSPSLLDRSTTTTVDNSAAKPCPLDELFAGSDVISLNCPQTDTNAGFVDAQLLAQVKAGCILINTARGGLVNETDLAEALRTGRLAAALLDVVAREPIDPDNPLLEAPNCLLTPHNAWATLAARKRMMRTTAENIKAFIEGHPINVVNAAL